MERLIEPLPYDEAHWHVSLANNDDSLQVSHAEIVNLGISRHYQINLLVKAQQPLQAETLLYSPIKVILDIPSGTRYFHGIIQSFHGKDKVDDAYLYRIHVYSPLFELQQQIRHRNFIGQTVLEILEEILQTTTIEFQIHAEKDYPIISYLVQLNEANLDFFNWLLNEWSLFYWFEQLESTAILHISDDIKFLPKVVTRLPFREITQQFYNEYAVFNVLSMQPEQMIQALSNCRVLLVGQTIQLTEHPDRAYNQKYRIIAMNITQHVELVLSSSLDKRPGLYGLPFARNMKPYSGLIPATVESIFDAPKNAYLNGQGQYHVRFAYDTSHNPKGLASQAVTRLLSHSGNAAQAVCNQYGTHFPLLSGTVVLCVHEQGNLSQPFILNPIVKQDSPNSVTSQNHQQHVFRTEQGQGWVWDDSPNHASMLFHTPSKKTYLHLSDDKLEVSTSDGSINASSLQSMHWRTLQNHKLHAQNQISYETTGNRYCRVGGSMNFLSQGEQLHTASGKLILQSQKHTIVKSKGNYELFSQANFVSTAKEHQTIQLHRGGLKCYAHAMELLGHGEVFVGHTFASMTARPGVLDFNAREILLEAENIIFPENTEVT